MNNHLLLGDIGVGWEIGTEIVIENNGVNPVIFKYALNCYTTIINIV